MLETISYIILIRMKTFWRGGCFSEIFCSFVQRILLFLTYLWYLHPLENPIIFLTDCLFFVREAVVPTQLRSGELEVSCWVSGIPFHLCQTSTASVVCLLSALVFRRVPPWVLVHAEQMLCHSATSPTPRPWLCYLNANIIIFFLESFSSHS